MSIETHFSSIYLSLLALIGGLVILVSGGEALVSGAVKLASRMGMSALLIGLTVVAFGTSMPEFFVSLSASFQGTPDIMLGNVIGSNIANVGLILGVCALISPLHAPFFSFFKEIILVLVTSFAVIGLAWYGFFPRAVGFIFITILFLFTYFSYKNGTTLSSESEQEGAEPQSPLWLIYLLCLGGLICLSFGSNLFIKGAVDVAHFFGVSNLIIGLTMAAVGTSLPELASSISAIRRGETDLLMGNIIGSNLFNLLMVLGGIALIKPFPLDSQLLLRDLPVMTFFTAVLLPVLYFKNKIHRLYGFLLLLAYGLYMLMLV
ncbi:MAG: calcium/sodium antiporter [Desulfobulbaceae bacterium]|nr:calcium/sodium antiporter [Desulfobulbaceae bacterium]